LDLLYCTERLQKTFASRDTIDLLVIARDMQRAGAGIRSLAEPFLDTTSDFAEIIFAILGVAEPARGPRRRGVPRRPKEPWGLPRRKGQVL